MGTCRSTCPTCLGHGVFERKPQAGVWHRPALHMMAGRDEGDALFGVVRVQGPATGNPGSPPTRCTQPHLLRLRLAHRLVHCRPLVLDALARRFVARQVGRHRLPSILAQQRQQRSPSSLDKCLPLLLHLALQA